MSEPKPEWTAAYRNTLIDPTVFTGVMGLVSVPVLKANGIETSLEVEAEKLVYEFRYPDGRWIGSMWIDLPHYKAFSGKLDISPDAAEETKEMISLLINSALGLSQVLAMKAQQSSGGEVTP